ADDLAEIIDSVGYADHAAKRGQCGECPALQDESLLSTADSETDLAYDGLILVDCVGDQRAHVKVADIESLPDTVAPERKMLQSTVFAIDHAHDGAHI